MRLKVLFLHILSDMPFDNKINHQLQRPVAKEIPGRLVYLGQLVVMVKSIFSEFKKYTELDILKSNFVAIGAGHDLAVGVTVALRLIHLKNVARIDIEKPARSHFIANAAL